MAKQLKDAPDTSFDPKQLKKSVETINRVKAKATEMNGEAGAATKAAVDEHNFDKTALTFTSRLARKEPADAAAIAGACVAYFHAMGFFDTSDMFQDHTKVMRKIIEDVDAGKPGKGSNVTSLNKMIDGPGDGAPVN
ncbi:hypothetical protein [Paracoccus sp. 22332]|uniref:hypothetical protein n=1 Tax=Paracoccus sp. 22332 TaxID=3453913 RepID=UPI003F852B43